MHIINGFQTCLPVDSSLKYRKPSSIPELLVGIPSQKGLTQKQALPPVKWRARDWSQGPCGQRALTLGTWTALVAISLPSSFRPSLQTGRKTIC